MSLLCSVGHRYISALSAQGCVCNCDLHCPAQGLEAEAAGDEGADARSEALQVVPVEDDAQRSDEDVCVCSCRASRMPGEDWPA